MSFTIPSESISIKDCLSMALAVSSGSYTSASVENSLVVRNYSLEFFTPTQSGQGDGRVPTLIENAFQEYLLLDFVANHYLIMFLKKEKIEEYN